MGGREKRKSSVIKGKIKLHGRKYGLPKQQDLQLPDLEPSPTALLQLGGRIWELWRGGLGAGSRFPLPHVIEDSVDFKPPCDQTQTRINHQRDPLSCLCGPCTPQLQQKEPTHINRKFISTRLGSESDLIGFKNSKIVEHFLYNKLRQEGSQPPPPL